MVLGVLKSLAGFLLLLNLCMFVIVAAIGFSTMPSNTLTLLVLISSTHVVSLCFTASSVLLIDSIAGRGKALPVGYSPVYFPTGNEASGLMIIFALITAIVGAASCLSGLLHLRVWTAQSLTSNSASSRTAWAFTLLAIGLACKEMIYMGGRNTKLVTLESFLIIFCGTKLFLLLCHSGGNYCSYPDTYISTSTTRAESQRGSTTVVSSV